MDDSILSIYQLVGEVPVVCLHIPILKYDKILTLNSPLIALSMHLYIVQLLALFPQ